MKKLIESIIVTLIVTMLLTGCSKNSTVSPIRQLELQLQSSNYADWNAVATCEYATEDHLLTVAMQCSKIRANAFWAKKIATSISNNPSCTAKVIKELSASPLYAVLNITAQSTYADEETLIFIAKKCSSIKNNEKWAKTIATSISENSATTGPVIKQLSASPWYSVLNIAAQSTHADEDALVSIARQCSSIENNETFANDITLSICENPATTRLVLKELANSKYITVKAIARAISQSMQ